MKIYILINDEGEFLCKKKGKIYTSKTDTLHVICYKYLTNIVDYTKDKAYWGHRKIPIGDFTPRLYDLSLTPVDK